MATTTDLSDPTIRAWTYTTGGYPSCLQDSFLPAPSAATPLRPTQLLVRVRAAALNPADIQLMNLPFVWSLPYFSSLRKGFGADFSGTVIAAGGAAAGFAAGDEVFGIHFVPGSGTCQEVVTVDVARGAVVAAKPEAWAWTRAAALPLVWLTSRTCVAKVEGWVPEGGTVAVLGGSSATGMYAVHLARRYVTIVGDKTDRGLLGGAATYLWNPQMVLRTLLGKVGLRSEAYECVNLELRKDYLEETLELDEEKIVVDSTFSFNQVKEALDRLNSGRCRGKVVVEVGS